MDEVYTADWAEQIINDLSQLSSSETIENFSPILEAAANQLKGFLDNFSNLKSNNNSIKPQK